MQVVRFSEYRQYDAMRVEINNSMMALLAGAGMAAHFLQLTEGSERLLPEVFPRVAHIGRFNLTSAAAREILASADEHLSAMSVPYVLALHEDYLKTCIRLLERAGTCPAGTADKVKLFNGHKVISDATAGTFNPGSLHQINTIRLMRNCLVHAGSRVSPELLRHLGTSTADIDDAWIKVAGRSPSALGASDVVTFTFGEALMTLACTKVLAREANVMLQSKISPELWADLIVEDLHAEDPRALTSTNAIRKLKGRARFDYAVLALNDQQLADALTRWSASH